MLHGLRTPNKTQLRTDQPICQPFVPPAVGARSGELSVARGQIGVNYTQPPTVPHRSRRRGNEALTSPPRTPDPTTASLPSAVPNHRTASASLAPPARGEGCGEGSQTLVPLHLLFRRFVTCSKSLGKPAAGPLRYPILFAILPACLGLSLSAAEVDESKLPPPASVTIDFSRDIKPILENSCFRCHGPEKPRSNFRLDNRDAALRGGDNGVDILPGNSAKSPLIHYVAHLVPDMEMPPLGKGDPLTADQISLLRAWIDQGVAWETVEPVSPLEFSLSPTLRLISVSGDNQKFREHYWQKEGVNGGVEQFDWHRQLTPDSGLTASGHVLQNDYQLRLALEKNEIGFIRAGWEQYRKYYDNTGGYYPLFTPSTFNLDRDLFLDDGRAWVDFGLTLPNWPQMVFGYEYQYRKGDQSTLQWGDVVQAGIDRKIAPASEHLDEHVHIIKFDLEHEISGVRIEDSFRGEFYSLSTRRTNILFSPFVGSFQTDDNREGYRHFQGANSFRLEKQFNDWLFASGGYFYSQLNADASFTVNTFNVSGPLLPVQRWSSQQVTLERESHILNLNMLLGPWDGLTLSSGVQSEWTREKGFGNDNLDDIIFPGNFFFASPVMMFTDLDKAQVEENVALRYTKIPFTALFAEVKLQQESLGQFEEQVGGFSEFLRDTDFDRQSYDMRVGFNTSPWTWVSLSAHYRRYDNESRYNNTRDEAPIGFPGFGYSAFIRSRSLLTDEVETKAVFRPLRWLKTTLSYQLVSTDYHTATDPVPGGITSGSQILAGTYDSHIYTLSTTLTPWQRLYLSTTFSYQDSATITANNGATAIVPYRGDIYTALASGTYVLSQASDLILAYSFSYGDFSQGNFVDGLPLGLRYQQHGLQVGITRRIAKNFTTQLQYGYFYYNEPSSGGANNYSAHAIFGTFTYRFP
ncbi:MAG: Planctomycete cytochrome [Pedosphaera sp.]|nr:Planctomycete cytochrome [Pedosphaera sp.]